MPAEPPRHPIMERLHARRARHLARGRLYRIVFAAAGFALLIIGLGGLALPVLPGWPLLIIGLALLALEFAWAERMLERVIDKVEGTRQSAAEASFWQKVFGALAVTAAVAAVVAGGIYWDLPLLPF